MKEHKTFAEICKDFGIKLEQALAFNQKRKTKNREPGYQTGGDGRASGKPRAGKKGPSGQKKNRLFKGKNKNGPGVARSVRGLGIAARISSRQARSLSCKSETNQQKS